MRHYIGMDAITKAKMNGVSNTVIRIIYIYIAHIFFFIVERIFFFCLAPLQIHAVQHSLFMAKNKFTLDLLQIHTVRQQYRPYLLAALCIHFRFVGLHAEIETVTQVQSACCPENQTLAHRYYIVSWLLLDHCFPPPGRPGGRDDHYAADLLANFAPDVQDNNEKQRTKGT